ncbi:MAG: MBL fold metallo-hydrolase [Elusimicrobia bacterium]|nr:MBL fold metallo-hydrolase [Elusimicrobiota bacterium]
MKQNNTLIIHQLAIGDMANFTYLIADSVSKEAFVIDPQEDLGPVEAAAAKDSLKITGVLLTHGHYDHVGGLQELTTRLKIPVYLSEHEAPFYTPDCPGLRRTKEGARIPLGKKTITCLHTPGHTPGCQCFLIDGNLFTGDLLFIGGTGRTDLPGGNSRQMQESLQRVLSLEGSTVVWPGHDYGDVPFAMIKDLA